MIKSEATSNYKAHLIKLIVWILILCISAMSLNSLLIKNPLIVEIIHIYLRYSFRISFFFLGTIVSMSIFVNNYKVKLSSATNWHLSQFQLIIIGTIAPLTVIFTNLFINMSLVNIDGNVLYNFNKLSVINITAFIFSVIIFILVLAKFILSFWTNAQLFKTMIKIKFSKIHINTNINFKILPKWRIKKFEKRLASIESLIEIYTQNIKYILDVKNESILKENINNWNKSLNELSILIFHMDHESFKKVENNIHSLYRTILQNNIELIDCTVNKYELRDHHKTILIAMCRQLPHFDMNDFKKQKEDYQSNFLSLQNIFFEEIHIMFKYLSQKCDEPIFKLFNNGELNFHNIFEIQGKISPSNFNGNEINDYFEDLLISFIFQTVENNNNDNLTDVMALILSHQEFTYNISNVPTMINLPDKKGASPVNQQKKKENNRIVISKKTIKGLIYSVIKANEIENYKAAGYIVKVISSHISAYNISIALKDILEDISLEKVDIALKVSKLSFNKYSLLYCFNKTVILFDLQYYLKSKQIIKSDQFINNSNDILYILNKLEIRKKEYSLLSLEEDNIEKYRKKYNLP